MTEKQTFHKTVLAHEVLEYLDPKPEHVYIDATFGSGGHTRAILEREPKCSVIALDWDQVALDTYGPALKEEFGDRLTLIWGNFALLYKIIRENKITRVDGILADFGTSQIQIINRPGFSVHRDTALDMRMSPAHQKITAAELLNKSTEEKLREIFWQFGQERNARQIAAAIVQERTIKPFRTTAQLAELIARVSPNKNRRIHPATQVFQALRIFVNKELDNISSFLAAATTTLHEHGKLVCISFHSLEDRLVKQFFKEKEKEDILTILTPHMVSASEEELIANPSSRSACLRAAEKREQL